MKVTFSSTAAAVATGVITATGLFVLATNVATPALAVPPPSGACCSIGGCCSIVSINNAQPNGGVAPSCVDGSTQFLCDFGVFHVGTTCDVLCATTTTTLPPTGACCSIQGCCSAPSSLVQPNGVGGNCFETTDVLCDFGNTFKGDGTTCLDFCPTTTTTLAPSGACCLFGGGCNNLTPQECDGVGEYSGDATDCESAICAPTTTTSTTTTTTVPVTTTSTLPATTTTTLEASICGDANEDGNITAPDALVALKVGVGVGSCVLARCDYDGSGKVSASDALAILKKAVGQPVVPMCPLP